MTISQVLPARWVPAFRCRLRADSLLRNSLYLMTSSVVTAGLGYLFWLVAAHTFTRHEIGATSAMISLCSTAALLTYLGPSATLIDRLPGHEGSARWTGLLTFTCVTTAAVTCVVTAAALPVLLGSREYRDFPGTASVIAIAVAGACAWTVVNLLSSAFIAARRAGRFLSIQTLVSAAKVGLMLPLAAAGAGAAGLLGAWVASAVLGAAVGAVWLVPQMGLGRRLGHQHRRRAGPARGSLVSERSPAHHRWPALPSRASVSQLLGQHLTSVGGAATPLILPAVVAFRLGATQNAYFYIAWMLGGIFFMVSPSVASALFAEGVRARSDLRGVVVKALRVIALILAPVMVIMVVGGKFILGLFGAGYAASGYGLLILLVISALPDAVSNVAVSIYRVTHRLGYSSALNLGMSAATLIGAWFLMVPLGIAGVGVAWLCAQTLGAIACLPAYVRLRRAVIA